MPGTAIRSADSDGMGMNKSEDTHGAFPVLAEHHAKIAKLKKASAKEHERVHRELNRYAKRGLVSEKASSKAMKG